MGINQITVFLPVYSVAESHAPTQLENDTVTESDRQAVSFSHKIFSSKCLSPDFTTAE